MKCPPALFCGLQIILNSMSENEKIIQRKMQGNFLNTSFIDPVILLVYFCGFLLDHPIKCKKYVRCQVKGYFDSHFLPYFSRRL